MPTGYTAAITEGDGITFEQYVWSCARAFGALILMRDDPQGAPIPERFEPSDWHLKELAKAQEREAWLLSLTGSQVAEEAAKAQAAEREMREGWQREREEREARYRSMLAQVQAWEPPTPEHAEFKAFMASQITQSIEFDCRPVEMPAPLTPLEWWKREWEQVRWHLEYHAKEHAAEVERTEKRNQWLAALRASVPVPEVLR